MRLNHFLTVVMVVGVAALVAAQVAVPRFEAASIKFRISDAAPSSGSSSPDRFVRNDTTLRDLVRYSFDVEGFLIDGGPGWTSSTRFEVVAKANMPATTEQMRGMVKDLLQHRFSLKTHTEERDLPTYGLVMARGDGRLGEKLRPSARNCEPVLAARAASNTSSTSVDPPPSCAIRSFTRLSVENGRPTGLLATTMILEGVSIGTFASLLQSDARRVIVDKTGLTGTYDIAFEFQRQSATIPGFASLGSSIDGPSLFTALQEQLGLKLESERGPVDIIVIDSVQLPTPN